MRFARGWKNMSTPRGRGIGRAVAVDDIAFPMRVFGEDRDHTGERSLRPGNRSVVPAQQCRLNRGPRTAVLGGAATDATSEPAAAPRMWSDAAAIGGSSGRPGGRPTFDHRRQGWWHRIRGTARTTRLYS